MTTMQFFKNTKDDLHCVQASLKSVLSYYFPQKKFTYAYLDKVTAHKKNKGTWDSAMLLFLAKLHFEIVYITRFDYKKFAKYGDRYLQSFWTDEIYQEQKKYSNLKQEQLLAQKLLKSKKVQIIRRSATFSDMRSLWIQNYQLMVPINIRILDNRKGYVSHMVVLTGMTKKFVYFHDPGNPPVPNRKASIKKFWQAAGYPNGTSVDLIGVRRK